MRLCLIRILAFTVLQSAIVTKPQAVFAQAGSRGLFETDEPLLISLKGEVRELLKDRDAVSTLHPLKLAYKEEGGTEISISVNVKTRGHFRKLKANCSYPPLMIHFAKKGEQLSTIFQEQLKLKLVMPCSADEYIIREWLVYEIYNLLTPKSFRARLVRVLFEDDRSRKPAVSFYGILLEEEKQLAKRNNMLPVVKRLLPQQTQRTAFLTMAVFQYLIGNTDWSVQFLQNIKLIAKDSNAIPVPVPYDFDHAGIVNAPYAHPAEALQMSSIRERRFRGYCMQNLQMLEPVFQEFHRLKDEIYRVYQGCTLLDPKYIRSTLQYLDEFYATINSARAWRKDFSYPCDKSGTGNVVIKGLITD